MVHHLSRVKDIKFPITQENHSTVHQGSPHRYHHLKTCRNKETWHPPRYIIKQFGSKKFWSQNNPTIGKMAVLVQITAATTGTTDQVKAK